MYIFAFLFFAFSFSASAQTSTTTLVTSYNGSDVNITAGTSKTFSFVCPADWTPLQLSFSLDGAVGISNALGIYASSSNVVTLIASTTVSINDNYIWSVHTYDTPTLICNSDIILVNASANTIGWRGETAVLTSAPGVQMFQGDFYIYRKEPTDTNSRFMYAKAQFELPESTASSTNNYYSTVVSSGNMFPMIQSTECTINSTSSECSYTYDSFSLTLMIAFAFMLIVWGTVNMVSSFKPNKKNGID